LGFLFSHHPSHPTVKKSSSQKVKQSSIPAIKQSSNQVVQQSNSQKINPTAFHFKPSPFTQTPPNPPKQKKFKKLLWKSKYPRISIANNVEIKINSYEKNNDTSMFDLRNGIDVRTERNGRSNRRGSRSERRSFG
jgi:hypothetical protein